MCSHAYYIQVYQNQNTTQDIAKSNLKMSHACKLNQVDSPINFFLDD